MGRHRGLPIGATLLLLLVGCGGQQQERGAVGSTVSTAPVPTTSPSTSTSTTMPAPESTADLPTGVVPVRIEIPAVGVDADVIDLDLRGPEPEVPSDFDQTGWYTQTRQPGEIGPSVIAGHIDSVAGPAVFARLDELTTGDEIVVHDATGQSRTFVVDRAGQYPKEALPDEVFGFDQPLPELRLITCGGVFDRSIGHYRDNYVVYASLAPTAP